MVQFAIPQVRSLPVSRPSHSLRRRVVFVVIPDSTPMEMVGAMEMLDEANFMLRHSDRPELGYDLEVVTTQPGTVLDAHGLKVVVDRSYESVEGEIDTLVFLPIDYEGKCLEDKRFLSWVAGICGRVRRVATVCIGTYILAEAGVLDGRRATTHWAACEDFQYRYPDVRLDPNPIFVRDGNIYTSAGATAGLDLMLAFIEEDFGRELALRSAQGLVLFLKRPGSQAQFSAQLSADLAEKDQIRDLQNYIAENLGRSLSVEELAAKAGMSPRNFSRVFAQEVGMTPGRFVETARLEQARRCLEDTSLPVAAVAERCGYTTPDGLRLAFERNLGLSPREYRKRFSSTAA